MPFTDRPTRELVALLVAATVCLVVLGVGVALMAIALAHPDVDLSGAATTWGHAVGILFGLMVGYLLGKREP